MTAGPTKDSLTELAQGLKLLLLDVDGVMTDGGIILIGEDQEAKRFDVQDGIGIALAKAAGLSVGIITSRKSAVVERRAKELQIDHLFQGVGRKSEVFVSLLTALSLKASECSYIGDDIQDTPVMRQVGIPIAVGNAVKETKECSVFVTTRNGGNGAVREAVEWLLDLRNCREASIQIVIG